MPEVFEPLTNLPNLALSFGQGIAETNENLARAYVENRLLAPSLNGSLFRLRNLGFRWHFAVSKEEKRMVFGFQRRSKEKLLLNAKMSMEFEPLPPERLTPPPKFSEMDYILKLPAFLLARLTLDEKHHYTNQLKRMTPQKLNQTLFFGLGFNQRHVLAVVISNPGRNQPSAQFQLNTENRQVVIRKENGKWPLHPFLGLMSKIAAWGGRQRETDSQVPLKVNFEKEGSDISQILEQTALTYLSATTPLVNRKTGRLLAAMTPAYRVTNFASMLVMRLNAEGDISDKATNQVFQLRLKTGVDESGDHPQFWASFSLPDFIANDNLRDNLIKPFLEGPGWDRLLDEMSQNEGGRSLTSATRKAFLTRAGAQPMAFRTKMRMKRRRKISTNIFVLRGTINRQFYCLIFKGDLAKAEGDDIPAEDSEFLWVDDKLEVLFFNRVRSDQLGLDTEAVNYFIRMANAFRRMLQVTV